MLPHALLAAGVLDLHVNASAYPAAREQHRVVLVTGSYDRTIDGVALTLNRLVGYLIRRGHEVLVLCPAAARGHAPAFVHAGAPVVRVPSVPLPIWSEYRLTWGLGREATRRLAGFEPTVMHIAVQDAMGHAAQRWAIRHAIPTICSHHTRFERYLPFYHLSPLTGLYWRGMRRFHGRCRVTLPPSESLRRELIERGVPRVGVWPRGVDTALFRPTARSTAWNAAVPAPNPEEAAAPVLLIVARLRWEKGLRDFAHVSRMLSARNVSHRLAVVGDGPARLGFRRLLPPTAAFYGTLTGADLARAYASSDVFLFPSTTEGWGATCLEAQASGLPVVATESTGIVDVVADGVGGVLLPPGDAAGMADAVAALVGDGSRRRAMGARGVDYARRYGWDESGERVLREYGKHADAVPPTRSVAEGRPPPEDQTAGPGAEPVERAAT